MASLTFGMAQVKDEACQKTKKRRSKNLTETERIAMIDLFREYQLDIESMPVNSIAVHRLFIGNNILKNWQSNEKDTKDSSSGISISVKELQTCSNLGNRNGCQTHPIFSLQTIEFRAR